MKNQRPDLIVITDDVYGTFVPGFRSLMAELPQNTIGVYSYSSTSGCTGWRLGVVAIHQNNIFDKLLVKPPARDRAVLNRRYSSISLTPEKKLKFIDRLVAESRQSRWTIPPVCCCPADPDGLFSLFALLDTAAIEDALSAHRGPAVKKAFGQVGLVIVPPTRRGPGLLLRRARPHGLGRKDSTAPTS